MEYCRLVLCDMFYSRVYSFVKDMNYVLGWYIHLYTRIVIIHSIVKLLKLLSIKIIHDDVWKQSGCCYLKIVIDTRWMNITISWKKHENELLSTIFFSFFLFFHFPALVVVVIFVIWWKHSQSLSQPSVSPA